MAQAKAAYDAKKAANPAAMISRILPQMDNYSFVFFDEPEIL